MKNSIYTLRRIINRTLGLVQGWLGVKPLDIFILCYHGFGKSDYIHDISPKLFEDQIKYLSKHANFVSLHDIESYIKGGRILPKPAVAITIDDGYKSIQQITPIIKKYNIHPTLFAISNPRLVDRNELDNSRALLSYSELRRLCESGWDIGSHTATHPDLISLTGLELKREIVQSKKELESKLRIKIRCFAYPKGRYDKESISMVKKSGYTMAVSMDDTTIDRSANQFTVSRIGINASHNMEEFPTLFTPWVSLLRRILKTKYE